MSKNIFLYLLLFFGLASFRSYAIESPCNTSQSWTLTQVVIDETSSFTTCRTDTEYSVNLGTVCNDYVIRQTPHDTLAGYCFVFNDVYTYAEGTCASPLVRNDLTSICELPECPTGFSKNSDGVCTDGTPCEYPNIPIVEESNNTLVCTSPDDFTNPDGTCKDGFAKDKNQFCQPDSDSDGNPDIDDSAPNDPNVGGKSDSQNEEPCLFSGQIRINNICSCQDGYFLRDAGVYGSSYTPKMCFPIDITDTGCPSNSHSSGGVEPTCICDDGYVKDPSIGTLCYPDSNTNDCNYPDTYNGFPFQSVTSNITSCRLLILSQGSGNGYIEPLSNCIDGGAACYFTPSSTDNNNSNEITDSNITDADNNDIINRLDIANNSLNDIDKSINDNSNKIINSLDTINGSIVESTSLNSQGLNNIIDAINNKPIATTDLSLTNDLLREISDKLSDDESVDDESKLSDSLSSAKELFDNALLSFDQTKNDLISLGSSRSAPTVSFAPGTCSLSTTIWANSSYSIDLSSFSQFRPYVQFILNLILLFFTIKLYIIIARDITKYFLGGN